MKLIARVLIGSQNYGLDTELSDKDYKLLYLPDFNDLYSPSNKIKVAEEFQNEHFAAIDVRKFVDLVLKGNPNAIELLYSIDWQWYVPYGCLHNMVSLLRTTLADGYLATVWKYFVQACKGLVFNTFDRNGLNEKTLARGTYFKDLCYFILAHNYKITNSTWRNSAIVEPARAVRLNQIAANKEEILRDFEILTTMPQPIVEKDYEEYEELAHHWVKNAILLNSNLKYLDGEYE